jgi:hypothetical protein
MGDNLLSRTTTSRVCIICLLTGLLASAAQTASGFSFSIGNKPAKASSKPERTTNRPWGNIGAYKSAPKYEQPAVPGQGQYQNQYNNQYNNQYLGAAPGAGWYNAQQPASTATTASEPRVEVEVSGTSFYEQQNVVYTVRVVSSDNLKTLNPSLPRVEGAILEQLDGPVASVRNNARNNSREIVNQYHYKLTPLRSGEVVIPPIKFKGTHVTSRQWGGKSAQSGNAFTVAADSPLTLQVLPADAAVDPWFPLKDLKLRAHMQHDRPAKEGIPVTLVLELKAKGAQGDQLPSLEAQLKSDSFRVYRDSVTTSNGISTDGSHLIGSRKETYTIIPLKDGWLRLPNVGVAWWDVDTDKPMLAGLPGQGADGLAGGRGQLSASAGENEAFSVWFWVPWMITLGVIMGYWLGAWGRTGPALRKARARTGAWLSALRQQTAVKTWSVGSKLSPVVPLKKVRLGFALMMPKTVQLWMCTRCLEHENSPEAWCNQFKQRACQHLSVAEHTPLPDIAEKIIEASPHAEPTTVRALAQTLDGAIYGGKPLDFSEWKKDFTSQLRPRLTRRHRPRARRNKAVLPELNPNSA